MKNKLFTALILLMVSQLSMAQDYVWAPDFPVGSTIPVLEAPDQFGNEQTLSSLTGEKGVLLVFNRSFDWCPFCKAQLIGLVEESAKFQELGLTIATITYDPVETLLLVAEDQEVNFSMLHDEELKHINAFGIRNMSYSPGERAYGIPEPGIMLVDPQGTIQYKFAEENYSVRPDWSDVLNAASAM